MCLFVTYQGPLLVPQGLSDMLRKKYGNCVLPQASRWLCSRRGFCVCVVRLLGTKCSRETWPLGAEADLTPADFRASDDISWVACEASQQEHHITPNSPQSVLTAAHSFAKVL